LILGDKINDNLPLPSLITLFKIATGVASLGTVQAQKKKDIREIPLDQHSRMACLVFLFGTLMPSLLDTKVSRYNDMSLKPSQCVADSGRAFSNATKT
jgi:hypothetical protein